MTSRNRKAARSKAPTPLLGTDKPVDWWFAFKFNGEVFPGCGGPDRPDPGIFGGKPDPYLNKRGRAKGWSLQYVYASSRYGRLRKGKGCLGTSLDDPLGATFSQIYDGSLNYVIWNDQFYGDPVLPALKRQNRSAGTRGKLYMDAPWGHSKGALAWNDQGEGFILQVTTPDWPGSGNRAHPRRRGNTLGCTPDDNCEYSQHFFALRLDPDDLVLLLKAMGRANVCTDVRNPQIVKNGGPSVVQDLVSGLGRLTRDETVFRHDLSSGVELLAKPAKLQVPPWCLVSAMLGRLPLRVASWWDDDPIPTTTARTHIGCWHPSLPRSGPVQVATTGVWEGREFGLAARGDGRQKNHAKIGVSLRESDPLTIFGDMNQTGTLSPGDKGCGVSQNARGGLFFVLDNPTLWKSVTSLMKGGSASTRPPTPSGEHGSGTGESGGKRRRKGSGR